MRAFIYTRLWFLQSDTSLVTKGVEGRLLKELCVHYSHCSLVGSTGKPTQYGFLASYTYQYSISKDQTLYLINRNDKRLLAIQYLKLIWSTWVDFLRSDDCILFVPPYPATFMLILASALGKNVLVYTGTDIEDDSGKSGKIRSLFLKFISDSIVGLSRKTITSSTRLYQSLVARNRLVEAPKPIIPELFYNKDQLRNDLLFQKKLILGFSGYIIPRKNIEFLIRSVSALGSHLDVELRIFGFANDAEYLQILNEVIDQAGASDVVTFLGGSNSPQDISEFYSNIDVLCVSSHSEGFPRVIYEAMSSGCLLMLPDRDYIVNSWLPHNCYLKYKYENTHSFVMTATSIWNNKTDAIAVRESSNQYINSFLSETSHDQFVRLLSI